MKGLVLLTLCLQGAVLPDSYVTGRKPDALLPLHNRNLIKNSGKTMIEKSTLLPLNDATENSEMPQIASFTNEQREYLLSILAAIRRVIEQQSRLETEETRLLGKGQFHWPKDGAKPVLRKFFFGKNFRMPGITLEFNRTKENAPWTRAWLSVTPRNFPQQAYHMGLPKEVFADFVLLKSRREHRPDEDIKNPVVFYFVQSGGSRLTLKVESRDDLASVDDKYPSSFYSLDIVSESKL